MHIASFVVAFGSAIVAPDARRVQCCSKGRDLDRELHTSASLNETELGIANEKIPMYGKMSTQDVSSPGKWLHYVSKRLALQKLEHQEETRRSICSTKKALGLKHIRENEEVAFHVQQMLLLSLHPVLASVPSFQMLPRRTHVRLKALEDNTHHAWIDSTINELLKEKRPDALPALLGRKLGVLTDPQFMSRLEARRTGAADGVEVARVSQLIETVLAFLEMVTEGVSNVSSELTEVWSDADDKVAEMARVADTKTQVRESAPPRRRAASPSAPSSLAAPSTGEDAERNQELMAQKRFLLERLLEAAKMGQQRVDELLVENRDSLDDGFFRYLQWEVDQQIAAKNDKLLAILEVVVQRACQEVENGQVEIKLLTSLLHTASRVTRQELYQRSFVSMPEQVREKFMALVVDTQLELEKKILQGAQVDTELLSKIRVIALEANDLMERLKKNRT